MILKISRKPYFWAIVSLFIGFIIALPMLISRNSAMYYFNQIGSTGDVNGTAFSWFSWSSFSQTDDYATNCSSPLKVYMYELPRKYNLGLLQRDDPDQEIPWASSVVPPWKMHFEVNNQHSVEYWLMVYLLRNRNGRNGNMAAVRVKDPEQAEVFFVPFFASLSFNSFARNMTGPSAAKDRELQEGVVEMLSNSKWWQNSKGRDHIIVIHHPNAFRYYRDTLNQSMFIVADFGRYNQTVARLKKDIVAPYVHVVPSFNDDNASDPFSARKTLLFFQGRVRRKADGVIRAKLGELLMNQSDVHYEDSLANSEAIAMSTEGMRSSRFCLHPAGDTPSSCRLFDAIVSHCVPVIVSDRIELPFEDDLDYSEFSIFFSAEEAVIPGHLLGTLRSITKERWLQMWNKLKAISHHFDYQDPSEKDDAVNFIFKQVQRKVPGVSLDIHRSKRLRIPDWWSRRR